MKHVTLKLKSAVRRLLVKSDGPLTRELLQKPSAFGLGRLPSRTLPDQKTTMTCGFCSIGCGLDVLLKNGEAVGLVPSKAYPVNMGMACPKGWEALTPLKGPGRAMTPLVRRDGQLKTATWGEALGEMVFRFRAIQEQYGPEAVAWIGSGQLPTEELAFLGAVAKFGLGIVHGDGNTRQCMATAATAYKQSFGFDAPPFTYADFEASDVIILVGSNLCIAHPILWERICKNLNRPKIVVIDPRATETAMGATHHYAPAPKTDLVLLYAVANWLITQGKIDQDFISEHTNGFEAFREHVAQFSIERASLATGLAEPSIVELAELIAEGQRVSFWWTMGVNQSHEGVRTAQALINLALMTKNIGRPGTGANSITGQCNAMGSRLFSNTTNLFGGRSFENAEDREEVAQILGIPVDLVPSKPSLAYDQIIDGILAQRIRALWVIGTNPLHSWINQSHLKDVLARLDCLVVQDLYHDTETARAADILLPAAGWGEKEGTFINSERRIGVIKRVVKAPGQALADFNIFRLVAEAFGVDQFFSEWSSPEAVFQILKRLSRGKPCDITGISGYQELDRLGGIQWPLPAGVAPGLPEMKERRLFEDGRFFTEDGRAKFFFDEPRPLPELTTRRFPLLLLTGRGSSSQWHTQTRTKRSPVLCKLSPQQLHLEISTQDARELGILPNEEVVVSSQRGSLVARAFVTPSVKPGQVFLPMHDERVNQLTFAAFDPISRQPAYKASAVRVERGGEIS